MPSTALLRRLHRLGLLEQLFREGVISYKGYMTLHIRDKVDSLMRSGRSRGEAVRHVANEMKMSRQNIYNYLE
jgi:hypothetical protein